MQTLHGILRHLAAEPAWQRWLEWQEVLKAWPEAAGRERQHHAQPLYVQRGVLHLGTTNAVWAQQLAFERLELLERLNQHLSFTLKDLRFRPALSPDQQLPSRRVSPVKGRAPEQPGIPKLPCPHRAPLATPCPRCQAPTPLEELDLWRVCALCRSADIHRGL
ncbi:MAG: DUF721 domain-containing protein [Gloeomargaritaceae cyanobacterium C42_A2020_066]|nr:DUF721 domain-containing protein [Gloeomargaritaceae cyanobacterium C42_A2020_066]